MAVSQIEALRLQRSILELVDRIEALRPIHAVGIAEADDEGFVTQVFLEPIRTLRPELFVPLNELNSKNGKALEVIFAPQCTALSSPNISKSPFTMANPTILAGSSISLQTETTKYGTLGYFCRPVTESLQDKAMIPSYILSNSHVLSKIRTTPSTPGEMICLPAIADNGGIEIAIFRERSEIDLSATSVNPNLMDVAFASIVPGEQYSLNIPQIGKVRGILNKQSVKKTLACVKQGRSTGLTSGLVVSKNVAVRVDYDGDKTWFANQIIVTSASLQHPFCAPGDSGSLVVIAGPPVKAIGILFAGAVTLKDFTNKNLSALASKFNAKSVKKLYNFGAVTHISDIEAEMNIKLELA